MDIAVHVQLLGKLDFWGNGQNVLKNPISAEIQTVVEFCSVSIEIQHLCPKNLTFPKAEREQRYPSLVIVVFCYLMP